MTDTIANNLGTLVGLLSQATRLADTIKSQAPDVLDDQVAYQASMWSDYLTMFHREASTALFKAVGK